MRHTRVGLATSLMVGTPFVVDYALPQLHSVLLVVPFYPSVHLTDFLLSSSAEAPSIKQETSVQVSLPVWLSSTQSSGSWHSAAPVPLGDVPTWSCSASAG